MALTWITLAIEREIQWNRAITANENRLQWYYW